MEKTLKVQEGLANLSSRVQESANGIHVVRAYVREEWQNAEWFGDEEPRMATEGAARDWSITSPSIDLSPVSTESVGYRLDDCPRTLREAAHRF